MCHTFGGDGAGGLRCHTRQCACLQGLATWLETIGRLAVASREGPLGTCGGWWGTGTVSAGGQCAHHRAAEHQVVTAIQSQQEVHLRAQGEGPGAGAQAVEGH